MGAVFPLVGSLSDNDTFADALNGHETRLDSLDTLQAWVAPTLSGTWVNYGGSFLNAGYWKDPWGIVHLKGMVKDGTSGTSIFTLPSGYRPTADSAHAIQAGNAFGRVDVKSNGNVTHVTGATTDVSLDGITFRTS